MTGQESLQKATIALQSLQRKYGQAGFKPKSSSSSSNSSSGFLDVSQQAAAASGSADTKVAVEAAVAPSSGRSSFEFCAAVGLREATRLSERAHSSRVSEGAHPSRLSGGAHSSSSADESSHEGARSSASQAGHPEEEQDGTAQTSQSHMVAKEMQPRHRLVKQKKCRALQISAESAQEVDVHSLQSPGLVLLDHYALAPNELARQNDSYALALQNRSVRLNSWSPQPSDAQASGHGSTCPTLLEADLKPLPDRQVMGAQGRRQSPDEQLSEAQGTGQFPEGQVLEGQGRGLFLGPPAQRWAADSALKESMNRLPTLPEDEEDSGDVSDSTIQLQPCASGSPGDEQGKERLQLPAGQNNCKAVHSSMTGKASRRVTFAISNVQQYPADQENVPI